MYILYSYICLYWVLRKYTLYGTFRLTVTSFFFFSKARFVIIHNRGCISIKIRIVLFVENEIKISSIISVFRIDARWIISYFRQNLELLALVRYNLMFCSPVRNIRIVVCIEKRNENKIIHPIDDFTLSRTIDRNTFGKFRRCRCAVTLAVYPVHATFRDVTYIAIKTLVATRRRWRRRRKNLVLQNFRVCSSLFYFHIKQ